MSTTELPNLHDAVFVRAEIAWGEGRAVLELERLPGVQVLVVAVGLARFEMTRSQPWGPSVSVNRAELRENDENGRALEMEMQSGDRIEVTATRFDVSQTPA